MGTSVIAGHNGGVTYGYYAAAYIKQPVGMIFLRNAVPAAGTANHSEWNSILPF